jgi:hypothetical protein
MSPEFGDKMVGYLCLFAAGLVLGMNLASFCA